MNNTNTPKIFAEGLSIFNPNPKAPDFVKLELSFTDEFIDFMKKNKTEKYFKLTVKASQKLDDNGKPKLYAEINDFKPKSPLAEKPVEKKEDEKFEYPEEEINPESIPF